MKKIIVSTFAFVLLAGAAQAQVKDSLRHHKGGHRGGHEMLAKNLNLSADQQAKLKALREQQMTEMKALKSNTSLTAEQQKAQKAELHKKYRSQSEAIYTPEQKQQIQKMKAEWKEKGKNKKGNRDGQAKRGFKGGKGEGFAKDLNLTQDQKDRMAKLRTEAKSSFESIRNDKNLTEDQRKEKFQTLRKQQQEQMKSILTAEQLEKMKAGKKDHSGRNTK